MTVPQSLLVVTLALAWLIVLVPSSSRRRGRIRETIEGNGFRVLHRPGQGNARGRRLKPGRSAATARADRISADNSSEDDMASESTEVSQDVEAVPAMRDSANEAGDATEFDGADDETTQFDAVQADDSAAPTVVLAQVPDQAAEETQLRAEYDALREQGRRESAAAAAPERSDPGAIAGASAAAPSRSRGGRFDPEAAERARRYKYSQRRRVVLLLLALTVGFGVGSVVVSPMLWFADGAAVVLLVLFLTYLRRQVKIEADIRQRRLAKHARARQIRPEAERFAGPAYGRAVSQDGGSAYHRRGRVAVDLDDDDPAFDDLEQYAPVVYQRASGQ